MRKYSLKYKKVNKSKLCLQQIGYAVYLMTQVAELSQFT